MASLGEIYSHYVMDAVNSTVFLKW